MKVIVAEEIRHSSSAVQQMGIKCAAWVEPSDSVGVSPCVCVL